MLVFATLLTISVLPISHVWHISFPRLQLPFTG